MSDYPRIGLVLTGGGARGAYQAGALLAIAEIAKEAGIAQPFPVITGMSAGAINAAFLASGAADPVATCLELRKLWLGLTTEQVFRVDLFSAVRTGLLWLLELVSAGLITQKKGLGLLDTSPLQEFLATAINWENIPKNISANLVHFLSITAVNYGNGASKTFYQSNYPYEPLERSRRTSEPSQIGLDHVMASTAIPFLFPPKKLDGWHFGDGSLRNHTPLSPAIKGGADRLLVIGVRREDPDHEEPSVERPSTGRIFSVLLNSLFLDALDLDLERVERINETLKYVPATAPTTLRRIPVHVVRPSQDIGQIALEEAHHLPRVTRWLLRGLGTPAETAGIHSYLLFEAPYTSRLVTLGYEDAICQKAELVKFLA